MPLVCSVSPLRYLYTLHQPRQASNLRPWEYENCKRPHTARIHDSQYRLSKEHETVSKLENAFHPIVYSRETWLWNCLRENTAAGIITGMNGTM